MDLFVESQEHQVDGRCMTYNTFLLFCFPQYSFAKLLVFVHIQSS